MTSKFSQAKLGKTNLLVDAFAPTYAICSENTDAFSASVPATNGQ